MREERKDTDPEPSSRILHSSSLCGSNLLGSNRLGSVVVQGLPIGLHQNIGVAEDVYSDC